MTTHKKGYGTGKIYSSNYSKDPKRYQMAFRKKEFCLVTLFKAMWRLVVQAFGRD